MIRKKVVLKEGKERSLLRRHPWIFSGAIGQAPTYEPGEVLPVWSASGNFLAQAYFNSQTNLAGRVLVFHQGEVKEEIEKRLLEALHLRSILFESGKTNAYRLINAEGDGLPGLIVDHYGGHLVLQISTWGMEKLRPFLLNRLIEILAPKSIYEKSLSSSRREEGLSDRKALLYGTVEDPIEVLENEIPFLVSIQRGQKTGFFLDQREMRQKIGKIAQGKRLLNCFGYTGGFALYALKGGAAHVTSVDSCREACLLAEKNTQLNLIASDKHRIVCADVFKFLEKEVLDYDLIVLDPPAFAKKQRHVEAALKGYCELNTSVLKRMPPQTLLLTCSCSYHIHDAQFQQMLFQASLHAKRNVRLVTRHLLAPDHPISIYHPEGEYLKSALLYIE